MLWSEERVAGQDEDKQILDRGDGGGDFLRLQWIEVTPVGEVEISREQALEAITR